MSERWQALMAMSASNTEKTKSEVEIALAQRKEKEAQARKQRAEAEKKQQELEKQMRLKHFENMQKEAERKKKEEEIRKAREAQVERQIAEAGIAALYGKKKAKTTKPAGKDANGVEWPSRSGQKSDGKRQRTTDDYDEPTGFEFLTREEKRQRKQQAEMAKLMGNSKKSGSAGRYGKMGSKLRGGAVDMTGPAGSAAAGGDSSKSIRQRLSAMPNTLMKLNTVKRDTRTIDEIMQDRQKEKEKKTLDGDEARGFDDWFGDKKDKLKKSSAPPTMMGSSAANSGANTPNSQRSTPQPSTLSNVKKSSIPPRPSSAQPRLPPAKGTSGSSNLRTSSSLSKPKAGSQPLPSFSKNGKSRESAAVPGKKRPRSPTPESDLFSDEDDYDDYDDVRPSKKRGGGSGIDIWAIMGMDKKKYTSRDYNSDDEDMEADALALEKEEKMSMKIARKEDQEALEAEKRHEEEKRRRKKERERAGRAY